MKRFLIAGGLVAVGAAAAFFLLNSSTKGFTHALYPIGDGQAVMSLRSNDDGVRYWLQLVDDSGTVRWRHATNGWLARQQLEYAAIVADEAAIYAYGDDGHEDDTLALEAYARSSGVRAWRSEIKGRDGETVIGLAARGVPSLVAGRVVHAYRFSSDADGESNGTSLIAHDAETGEEAWRFVVSHYKNPPVVIGAKLALIRTQEVVWLAADSGEVTDKQAVAAACFDGQQVLYTHPKSGDLMVVAPDGGRRQLVGVNDDPDVYGLDGCGRYGDALILSWSGSGGMTFAALDAKTGRERWRTKLPGVRSHDYSGFMGHAAGSPLSGPLPRVVVVSAKGTGGAELPTLVDLEKGTIVAEIDGAPMRHAFRVPQGTLLQLKDDGIALVDAAGAVAGAMTYKTQTSATARRVRGGQLWLFDDAYVGLDDVPWAVLDITNKLAIKHANGAVQPAPLGLSRRDIPSADAPPRGAPKTLKRVATSDVRGLLDAFPWSTTPAKAQQVDASLSLEDPKPGHLQDGCTKSTDHATGQQQCVSFVDGQLASRRVRHQLAPLQAYALFESITAALRKTHGAPAHRQLVIDTERCDGVGASKDQVPLADAASAQGRAALEAGTLCAIARFDAKDGAGQAAVSLTPAAYSPRRFDVTVIEGSPRAAVRAAADAAHDELLDDLERALKDLEEDVNALQRKMKANTPTP